MQTRLRHWQEWEGCWRMKTRWRGTTWISSCRRKTRDWLRKRKIVRTNGRTISKPRTASRLITQITVTSWLRTLQLLSPNWPLTDTSLTTLKVWDLTRLRTSTTRELSRWEITKSRSKDRPRRTCSGRFSRKRTDSWCCRMNWIWLRSRNRWT
jgi:hypothetical protein